ncbi:ATP-dependent RNA helicase RhlE domain protein [Burkholderia mallei]|nr:ATP-dependent RNA helicase RhlE domain protein [Burkholderia mallei]
MRPFFPPIRRRFEQARYSLPHHDDDVLRGIPNPPRSAASGCFGAFFSGCTGFASSGWFADGDGTYGFRKKSSIGASRRG